MEAALPSTASPQRSRLAFLDAARGTAMLMMVLGHVNDGLLSPAAKTGSFFEHYWAVRGLTAPLFLFVSGFAFVVASNPRWEEFRRPGPRLTKRLRRIGLLLVLGTFIQMPRWYGALFFDFTHAEWQYVLRWGVLQCVATAIICGHLLLALTRSKRGFAYAALALALAIFAATRMVTAAALPDWLPLPVRMMLRTNEGSPFPLFPWLGHFLCGAGLARLTLDRPSLGRPLRLGTMLGLIGAALLVASVALRAFQPERLLAPDYWVADPSLTMTRAGGAWCIFAGCAVLFGKLRWSPAWLMAIGARALSVYVLHLVALYGGPHLPGLVAFLGGKLPLVGGFALGPALLAACLGTMLAVERGEVLFVRALERLGLRSPQTARGTRALEMAGEVEKQN